MMKTKHLLTTMILVIYLTGCSTPEAYTRPLVVIAPDPNVTSVEAMTSAEGGPPEREHDLRYATISSVGDVMVHRSQLIRAYDQGEFDFAPTFQWVAPFLLEADYTIGNLETTLAGANGQRRIQVEKFFMGYSGYPAFNTPDVMAQNLKDAGFDLMVTSNNHSLDSKLSGLLRTIEVLEAAGLEHTGTFETEEASATPFIKEINGITFGIINYTYGMNGFWLTEEEDFHINHFGDYDQARINHMNGEVKAMERLGVDVVVVALHYGIEYRTEPDEYVQKPLIDGLFESGADIILGAHPHVLQPFEVRDLIREDGTHETGVVIYSMGNFISSQRYQYTGKETDYGMIFTLDFKKVNDSPVVIERIRYVPTYVHWSATDLEIIPVYDIPEAVELTQQDLARLQHAKDVVLPKVNSYYSQSPELRGAELVFELNPVVD